MKVRRTQWSITAVGFILAALTTSSHGKIPEPDNVVYGISREDAVTVTLEVNGEQIADYRMGENPDAGDYYILRVPIDALDPQTQGTARPGYEALIYINGEVEPEVNVTIGPRGHIQIVHLARADADADGIPDLIDRCPNTELDADVNLDGCSEIQIAASDWDGDGFTHADEIASGSDPDNPDSMPIATTLTLRQGYNQVTIPAEIKGFGDLATLMEYLGGSGVIEKLMILDSSDQAYSEAGYDEAGDIYGTNPLLPPPEGSLNLVIYAKSDITIHFSSMFCSTWNLHPGLNLAGSACPSPTLTAHELLQAIAVQSASATIQRFNQETGRFQTAIHDEDGNIVGKDFPIVPAEAYLLHLREDVISFRP